MHRRVAHALIAIAMLGSLARPHAQADPLAPMAGTWGQPPADGKPGLTGGIFTAYKDANGESRITLTFAPPSGWTCGLDDQAVKWNASERRFEWPNKSTRVKAPSCWIQADPRGDVLDVRMFCPYSCTKAEDVNSLQLARMAPTRLVAPKTVVGTFCSSADPLRHALCTPGATQDLIAEGDRLADQADVLSDGLDAAEPETEVALLAILDTCHGAAAGASCLDEQLHSRIERLQRTVSSRQLALAREREVSEARAIPLADGKTPPAWETPVHLVTDQVISTFVLGDCDARSCEATLSSETNYTFGYAERQGTCSIRTNVRFTAPDTVFGYVDVADGDRNEAGAGPFANFCRVDAKRNGDGVDISLRGSGCQEWCSESQFPTLAGPYRAVATAPSFACSDPDSMPWDEKIVCLDPVLAALDRDLAVAFARARKEASGAALRTLTTGQRAFLRERHEACNADRRYTCVKALYERRLRELTPQPK